VCVCVGGMQMHPRTHTHKQLVTY